MAISEGQLETIIRYLDNELLPEEEAFFIKQMAASKELQKAFDLEMILRQPHQQEVEEKNIDEENILFEPADKYLERAETIAAIPLHQKEESSEKTPAVAFWNIRKAASVAAAAILIAVISIFLVKENTEKKLAANPVSSSAKPGIYPSKDTTANPSATDNNHSSNNPDYLAQLAGNYYNRYQQSGDDPLEISLYYQSYKLKKYEEVLNATAADFETKGGSNAKEQNTLTQYMLFYKALSYIETGKPAKAAGMLDAIIVESAKPASIYFQAQFYLLMAYMQLNDRKNTQGVLNVILNTENNPNKRIAAEISRKLNLE